MAERDNLISPQTFVKCYEDRFRSTIRIPGISQMELPGIDVPLPVFQRFLLTGRFNSMFDEYMLWEGLTVVWKPRTAAARVFYESALGMAAVHPEITYSFRSKEGRREEQIRLLGPYLPEIGRIPEVVATAYDHKRIRTAQVSLARLPQEVAPPIDLTLRRGR